MPAIPLDASDGPACKVTSALDDPWRDRGDAGAKSATKGTGLAGFAKRVGVGQAGAGHSTLCSSTLDATATGDHQQPEKLRRLERRFVTLARFLDDGPALLLASLKRWDSSAGALHEGLAAA